MANSDDLDLRKLFGLSPEEAQGLGLESFGAPPPTSLDAPGLGLPDTALPLADHPAPALSRGAAEPADILADELALLALLDGRDERAAPKINEYNGHDAVHGLSLASSGATAPAPAAPSNSAPPVPLEDDDADDRFVVASADDVDVAALFGLSADEARGLGLDKEDAAAAVAQDAISFPSVPFPTMRLRALDGAGAAGDGGLDGDGEPLFSGMAGQEPSGPTPMVAGIELDAPEPQPLEAALPPQERDPAALRFAVLPQVEVATVDEASPVNSIDPALLDAFAEESAELLDGLHAELEALERDPADRSALLEIRRIVHTIKGGAKMCAFEAVATLTHSCENLLDLVADNTLPLDDAALRALFECEPLLRETVQAALGGQGGASASVVALAARFDGFCQAISMEQDAAPAEPQSVGATDEAPLLPEATPAVAGLREPEYTPEAMAPTPPAGDVTPTEAAGERQAAAGGRTSGRRQANSINVDLTKVDAVVAKVTEMAAHRASSHGMIGRLLDTTADARRNVTRLQNLSTQLGNEYAGIQPEEAAPEDDLALESYNAINTLILQLQEAVSDQLALVQTIHDTITNHWSLQATESRVDADIQSALMNIRLIPLANMRVRLDGVVRQAAEATGKNVRWQLQGGNVAIEKNVFDKLFEPLMHLLRNSVDHGIEPTGARRAAGKPETGSITVTAAQDGNQIIITVVDDGAGIIPNKIAALAVERGLVTSDEAGRLTYQQKMDLIFTPGFSTATEVSHISGRGVGMDAVREACLRMGGTIEVASRPGNGTTFTLRLPLSLSVTRGLIVRDSGCLMAVPVAQVTALHLVPASDVVATPDGRVARLEGQELPVYNLPSLPGGGRSGYIQNGEVNVLQVAHEGGSIGLVIEDVLGEEEILIKAPPALLRPVKTLLGAHVLPDGRVAPVVNLPQMLVDLQPVATLAPAHSPDASDELTALVVDDSMSMRVALTGTLQSAGFRVLTARDGQEALDVLKREGLPGLITLDVEMPRMDGLETLFAIRQMPGAHDLPIFMMTSRGGARHRRAAEQLGATRYFTKPYRDSELASAARTACEIGES